MANAHSLPFPCSSSINLCVRTRSYCLNKSIDVVASIQVITIPSILGELHSGVAVLPRNYLLLELQRVQVKLEDLLLMEALQMLKSLSEAKILGAKQFPSTWRAGVSPGPLEHKLEVLVFQGLPCFPS